MGSSHKGPVIQSFDDVFIVSLINFFNLQLSDQWYETPSPLDAKMI